MNRTADARWMVDRLAKRFGSVTEPDRDGVRTLVLTILSQNTTDTNRDRAYATLLDRFGSLDAVATASQEEIADAIRVGGLQEQKSRSILTALRRLLDERDALDLGFLDELPLDEALAWLLALPGVGRKTAGIVLLFAFGRPFFPIDTHIRRVLTRVGWIRGGGDPHRQVNPLLDPDARLMADLHLQLIRLGRTLCKPRTPRCEECPIRRRCDYGKELRSE
jgi:endonuclease-3